MGLDDVTNSDMIKTTAGTITDVSMNGLSILSDNGNDLTFSLYGAAIHVMNGFNIGNYVMIEYNGTITDDNDTSGVWVISITDSGASTSGSTDETAETDTEAADTNAVETSASEQSQSESGGQTSTESGTGSTTEAGTEGATASANTANTQETSGTETQTEGTDAENSVSGQTASTVTIRGQIVEATQNTVTVTTDDGATLTFATGEASTSLAQGLQTGNSIDVTYDANGANNSGVFTAISIADAE